MFLPPWPATFSVLAGLGTVGLIAHLWKHRHETGAIWFLATLVSQAVWCFSYGAALLVTGPTLRLALEIVSLVAMSWIGVAFLGFALLYTGRGKLVRSRGFTLLLAVPALTTILLPTNSVHELVFSDYTVDPVFGVQTVSYTLEGWAYFAIGVATLAVAAGTLLLFDTVVSYGPLYRAEALAVAVSAVPPGVALLVWALELGPYPQLNLTTVLFLPHVALDAYAFGRGKMFEYSPVAHRTAERNAIEELDNPVLALDADGRVITHNTSASRLFDVEPTQILGEPFDSVVDTPVDLEADQQTVSLHAAGERREFAISISTLTDYDDDPVGHTVVFQDVTTQRRRKQRLEILNRILRHNLRNELNVAHGYVGIVADQLEDEALRTQLEGAQGDIAGVIRMGEKAWAFERAIDSMDDEPTPIALSDTLEGVATDVEATFDGEIDVSVPADVRLVCTGAVFEQLFEQLLENALEHAENGTPRAEVTLETVTDAGGAVLTVRDSGPGIPEHELAVLERGQETALEHGSGIGLWIVLWCVTALGGDLEFETDDDGTTVRVTVPGVV